MTRVITVCLSIVLLGISACAPRKAPPPQVRYFSHEVKYEGETLGAIAAWYTGSANNWEEILDHNPGLRVTKMRIGDEILIPDNMIVREDPLTRKALASLGRSRTLGGSSADRSRDGAAAGAGSATQADTASAPSEAAAVGVTAAQVTTGTSPSGSTEAASPEKQKARDDLIDEILKQ